MDKTTRIKNWLGLGSINIFGPPMSGKDTVGIRLAETIGARFLSSGLILRQAEKDHAEIRIMDQGFLAPTDAFYQIVLPYLSRPDLTDSPLILSSVGRWSGEEHAVISSASSAGHPIRAALLLQISEQDILNRWETAKLLGDRDGRADDISLDVFNTRLQEFRTKTMSVVQTYSDLGILIPITADQPRDTVLGEVLDKLAAFASHIPDSSPTA